MIDLKVPPQHPVRPQNLVPPPGFVSPDQFYAPTRAAEDVQFESKVSTGQSDLKHKLEKKETELQLVLHEKKALENDFFKLEQAHKVLNQENRNLQKKHEKICSDVKVLRGEKALLTQEKSSLSVALKTAQKDLKDNSAELNKKLVEYKVVVEKLQLFKNTKIAEEKHLAKKSRKKLLENKKKTTIEDAQLNDSSFDSKEDIKYISNVPVSNMFSTLQTDETKHVDENQNSNEKSGVGSISEEKDKLEEPSEKTSMEELSIDPTLVKTTMKPQQTNRILPEPARSTQNQETKSLKELMIQLHREMRESSLSYLEAMRNQENNPS